MTKHKDYYQVLGIPSDSTVGEIKKAYRKLAKTAHPDKKSGNDGKFKELVEAYEILSDPEKRLEYDKKRSDSNLEYTRTKYTEYKGEPLYRHDSPYNFYQNPEQIINEQYDLLNNLLKKSPFKIVLVPGQPLSSREDSILRDVVDVVKTQLEQLQSVLRRLAKHKYETWFRPGDHEDLARLSDEIWRLEQAFSFYKEDRYKLLEKETHYQHANFGGGRYHMFAASADGFKSLKDKYSLMKGDYLKTKILSDFKELLDKAEDKANLNDIVNAFKHSDAYKVLQKGQGLFTQVFKLETSSIKALNDMVSERKQAFDHQEIQYPNK